MKYLLVGFVFIFTYAILKEDQFLAGAAFSPMLIVIGIEIYLYIDKRK